MTLSVLLYALMLSALVALVGLLVVDVIRGVARSHPPPPSGRPADCSARRRQPARSVTASRR
jgi:hypothetical protein